MSDQYGDICSADPNTLSYVTQAQCGIASLVGRVTGSAERTVGSVAENTSAVAVEGVRTAGEIAPIAAGAAAAGGVFGAIGLPIILAGGTVAVLAGDQIATGGKVRKALGRAVGIPL